MMMREEEDHRSPERRLRMAVEELRDWARLSNGGASPPGKDAVSRLSGAAGGGGGGKESATLLWSPSNETGPGGTSSSSSGADWSNADTASYAITMILRAEARERLSAAYLGRLLQVAARAGLGGVVRALVQTGADLDVRAMWRIASGASLALTVLQVAAASGHEELVLFLLSKPEVKADATVKGGRTVLHVAASCGQQRVVRRLLADPRVDREARDNERRTALHVAVLGGHDRVVRVLLQEGGVDASAADADGWTALHLAALVGDVRVAKALLACTTTTTTGPQSAGEGGEEEAEETAAAGSSGLRRLDVEARDNEGRTALHVAVERNREAMARFLLDKAGADRHALTAEGRESALHRAAFYGHSRMVRYLVEEAGLDREARDAWGHTALHLCAYRGHEEVVAYLLERAGADRWAVAKDGRTALHLAIWRGHESISKYLIGACGVDALVGVEDEGGCTPARLVPEATHPRLAKFLARALHYQSAVYELTDLEVEDAQDGLAPAYYYCPHSCPEGGGAAVVRVSFRPYYDTGADGRVYGPETAALLELVALPEQEDGRAVLHTHTAQHARLHHPRIAQYLGRVHPARAMLQLSSSSSSLLSSNTEVWGVLMEAADGSLAWFLQQQQQQQQQRLRQPQQATGEGVEEEEGSEEEDDPWEVALLLGEQVAEGLEVLHGMSTPRGKASPVVHGGLHLGSVWVKDGQARLGKAKGPAAAGRTVHGDVQALGDILARLGVWAAALPCDDSSSQWLDGAPDTLQQAGPQAWQVQGLESVATLVRSCCLPPPEQPTAAKVRCELRHARALFLHQRQQPPGPSAGGGSNHSMEEAPPEGEEGVAKALLLASSQTAVTGEIGAF